MKTPAELLSLPARRSVRWLALRFLDDAHAAHRRLGGAADAEALHDFRVALRRLRSLLRAFREPLAGSVGAKDRRRVRDLARATGESRDLEVQAAWLRGVLPDLAEHERPGAGHLAAALEARRAEADRALHREVARRFPPERKRLAKRLSVYQAGVSLDGLAEGDPLSAALEPRVAEAGAELRARLAAVRGPEDQDEAHEARIAAKRLRYLLEPFEESILGARTVVRELKRLQDVLGDMHDAEVLLGAVAAAEREAAPPADAPEGAEEAAGRLLPGLEALSRRLHARRAEGWEAFAPAWLTEKAERFFGRLGRVREALRAHGRPRDVEIERKFLLRRMPSLPAGAVAREIEQGWLPGERLQERVRRVKGPEGEKWFRTVKLGTGATRLELEEETTREVFKRLWPLTKGKRVAKRRYTVPDGALAWEIDRFSGQRLVLAEVELPSEDHRVEIPAWLRPVLVREVTGEREYVNVNLAK